MIGRDYSDIYVAACGEPFWSIVAGKQHEQYCHLCQAEIHGEEPDDDETELDDDD